MVSKLLIFALACTLAGTALGGAVAAYTIQQVGSNPGIGSSNNVFDVLLTVSGGSLALDSFSFEVDLTDPDITFTNADTNTTLAPYVFAGNSFDVDFSLPLANISNGGQTLDGSDLTDTFTDISLMPGTYGLGEVFYSISPSATPGPFTVTFGNVNFESISDAEGDTITPSTTSQGFQAGSPEPSTAVFGILGLALVGAARRLRR
jgi:PEP-CTERM motif